MYQINYQGKNISYQLIKSNIKNMYIQIKQGNVIVKAPRQLQENRIRQFVERKAKWIYEKVEQEQRTKEKEKTMTQEDIKQLEKTVEEALNKYAPLLGRTPNKVRIRNINYAWGSCSSQKNITINLKLATREKAIIEYVVLHEMCHLTHMNHSKDFWHLVEKHMPNYQEYKQKLKNE